jgi:glycosyltransferase involved in cell wall biosynthesis
MKLFLAGASLLPAYGGPAYSVSRLALALTAAGVQVGLWAPDQSAATTPLLPAEASVQRLTGPAAEALERFGHTDVLHDNGLWWSHNHQLANLAAARGLPRVVSTCGMLAPWALQHKRWKKRLAWWLYQRRDVARASCHHTTAAAEAIHVQRLKLGVPVRVIPNGVDVPEVSWKARRVGGEHAARNGKKTALFLGRIYPVKGLPMLIEAWAHVRPHGWRLQIVGPDEAGHRAEVETAVFAAGLDEVVSFADPLEGSAKQEVFFDADLFVLPTQSENIGMAIGEALAHGLPVLTTTGAPWPMLPQRGCGWWVEPTVEGLAAGLRQATALDAATLQAMGAKGREFVSAAFGWERVAGQFVSMYEDVMKLFGGKKARNVLRPSDSNQPGD